ncbi:MAG TPA: class I SAM-dependent methyltransferase [Candidatus Hydrogenedentes bacterium]|nr:class I SAM-dependent methyltransferase [Candidatus Hydrogenedentota bacterium]
MQVLLRRLTGWAYSGDTMVARWRRERMEAFVRLVNPPPGCRVVDLGGTESLWSLFDHDFRVTLVNLPNAERPSGELAGLTLVEGDACDLGGVFSDNSFDVVFSNSVIEHVGGAERQAQFSGEVRRLAPAYWVQTPSARFPIEPHTGVPLYWQLPGAVRARLHRGWEGKLPNWAEMAAKTRVLSRRRIKELFPDGQLYVERRFLLEKSYAAYRPWPAREAGNGTAQTRKDSAS